MNIYEFMDAHPILTVIILVLASSTLTDMTVGVARALRGVCK